MTTEHFTLQGARTAAITESTSRATIFIGSVSAGLVALGLIATATRIGTAFYAFGLILLSTLSFIGFVTCDRVLQSGIEELHYAERIARLRAYYFDFAPELTHYLASVADEEASAAQLEALFTAQREAEWGEFLSDCGKYETELAGEIAKGKPTLAELDEEEQSLDRLRRWYRTIRARDLFGAPSAPVAERRLKECTEALEDFAERVYQARERAAQVFKRLRIWEHGNVHEIRARCAWLPLRTPAVHHQLGHDVPSQESPQCERQKRQRP